MNQNLLISIVSHGQGDLISVVLRDLTLIDFTCFKRVMLVVTLNIPEDETFLCGYKGDIVVLRNVRPQGFGANHNQAFSVLHSDYFLVLNPDIEIKKFEISEFMNVPSHHWGAIAPTVYSPNGGIEDNARRYPTLFGLIKRVVFRNKALDYPSGCTLDSFTSVDWVAGMFILFSSNAYRTVQGFDDSYFMYLEDADICRRIKKKGYKIFLSRRQNVVHDARRSSLKSAQHFKWHLRSMLRYLFGV